MNGLLVPHFLWICCTKSSEIFELSAPIRFLIAIDDPASAFYSPVQVKSIAELSSVQSCKMAEAVTKTIFGVIAERTTRKAKTVFAFLVVLSAITPSIYVLAYQEQTQTKEITDQASFFRVPRAQARRPRGPAFPGVCDEGVS